MGCPAVRPRTWVNWVNLAAYIVNYAIVYISLSGAFGITSEEWSKKYQTLVTPAGYAFAIWFPITVYEGLWAVLQMFPPCSTSVPVRAVSPCWWGVCVFQALWTIVVGQDQVALSLICMLGILAFLLGMVLSLDSLELSCKESFVFRGPFALHLGWVICASAVNVNVACDAAKASPPTLLCFAIVSIAVVLAITTAFTLGVRTSVPLIGLVAAWAFEAIGVELTNPDNLLNLDRFNPHEWDTVVIQGVRHASHTAATIALVLGIVACVRFVQQSCRKHVGPCGNDGGQQSV